MRLNGWQRLGIVASCGWIAYWAFCGIQDALSWDRWQESIIVAAIYALVPVAAFWTAFWLLSRLARWVLRGFFPS
jgi:hypothetical protein